MASGSHDRGSDAALLASSRSGHRRAPRQKAPETYEEKLAQLHELRVVHVACASRVPERPVPEPPPPAADGLEPEALREVLDRVLDDLGAAHHRPFSRG